MDLKLNHQVLCVSESVISERTEQAIDCEFSLPDYCPDIEKILKCAVNPVITGISKNGSSITVDITCYINLLYCPRELSQIKGYEIAVSYSKSINSNADLSGCFVNAKIVTDYINCRAVNERKLEIHGAATIFVKGEERAHRDVVTDSECEHLQLKRQQVGCCELTAGSDKLLSIEEELELPQSSGTLSNIIKYTTDAVFEDCKLIANKAIVKGQFNICVLYCTEDGGYEHITASFPVNQIMELDGVNEGSSGCVRMSVAGVELKPYTNTDGECRSILMNARLYINAVGYNSITMDCVADCYSTECEVTAERARLAVKRLCCELNIDHNIKQTVSLVDNAVSEVVDSSCVGSSVRGRYDDGELTLAGEASVQIITKNIEGRCMFFEKNLPFEHKMAISCEGSVLCELDSYIKSCSFNILNSAEVELRIQLLLAGAVFCEQQLDVTVDITADELRQKQLEDAPALVVYYAKAGDSVWNIARRYNTAAAQLMQLNELADDTLAEDKMLLIPGV